MTYAMVLMVRVARVIIVSVIILLLPNLLP